MKLVSIDRLSLKMGLGIAALLLAALALSFVLLYRQHWNQVLLTARQHALVETQLVQSALEHQMLRNDRSLLQEMVGEFAGEVTFERLLVLDRQGRVAFSSDPGIRSGHFGPESPTCQVCHRLPPRRRSQTVTLEMQSGAVLRFVRPIENRRPCHACHDPRHRINGVLIADVSLEPVRRRLEADTTRMALGVGGLGFLLLGGLGLFFRRMIMNRLRGFDVAAKSIAAGQLSRRVPVKGKDALGKLESRFNDMAEAVELLVERVRQQRSELENIINGVDDGIVVLDEELRVVIANRAFCKRWAVSPAEVVGCSCAARSGGQCYGEQPCLARECLERDRAMVAIRVRREGEKKCFEEVHASPIPAQEGTGRLCVEVWRDITERRSAEARLAEYQRLASLSLLGSGFAHELNTPLATIGICLEQLQPPESAAEKRQTWQLARQQLERCSAITEQFLALSRGLSPEPQWFVLEEELQRVAELAEPLARQEGVILEVVPAAQTQRVFVAPDAVRQVLLNLVLNAIQVSKPQDTVQLVSTPGERGPQLEIRDQGPGIDPQLRERIFEPFFSGRAGGSGLGLFIALNLARQWGGDIEVASNHPRGTIMRVTLPVPGQDHA